MRIIFIVKDLEFEYMGVEQIVGLLKQAGFREVCLEGANYRRIKKWLGGKDKVVLAYSAMTASYRHLLDLNIKIKNDFPGAYSLFGGPHPTFFPEMIEEDGVDGVCIGEGEYAMLELLENLRQGSPITNIKNWWIKKDGKIYKNPLRPLIEDLDALPLADRSFSTKSRLFKQGKICVVTSRGCPYSCSYCFNPVYDRLYGNDNRYVRRRSVDSVISEIKEIKRSQRIRLVYFADDIFILRKDWIDEFSYRYGKELGLPFTCNVRANLVTEDIALLLKKAGCRAVSMGVECGDDYYLNTVLNRNMDVSQIIEASKIIRAAGIRLNTFNLIGIPGGSIDLDFKTLELNIHCKPIFSRVAILSPYPKTRIYENHQGCTLIGRNLKSKYIGGHWLLTRDMQSHKSNRRLENLCSLFPLVVNFPILFPLLRFMVNIPMKGLFSLLGCFWKKMRYF